MVFSAIVCVYQQHTVFFTLSRGKSANGHEYSQVGGASGDISLNQVPEMIKYFKIWQIIKKIFLFNMTFKPIFPCPLKNPKPDPILEKIKGID